MLPAAHGTGQDRAAVEESLQVVGQLAGRDVSLRNGFLQALEHDRFQIAGNVRGQIARRERLALENLPQSIDAARRLKGRAAGQQRVQYRPEGIDVGCWANQIQFAGGLFGGHKAGRAEHLPGGSQSRFILHAFGQTKVGHPRPPVAVEENVGRLQVAMDHVVLMGILHGIANRANKLRGFARR